MILFALNILFLLLVSLLIEFLKWAISFISLNNLFKSLSSSFLLYTFGVGMKFNFFKKSLCSLFEKENTVKLITFYYGSDLYLINSSIFFRNLTRFSLCRQSWKLHSLHLYIYIYIYIYMYIYILYIIYIYICLFCLAFCFGYRWSIFRTSLDFSFNLNFFCRY